ncbi:TonB-dependent siderophore receptor [Thermosynechococcaceae cyanobacterium BACA0444]|uniref:TonB-dependent siderophore receptor n=1 Tax=Pseudocalidococcus azoricus BACA0444 TaxID=2918990 RepID=A0AAE4FVF5_9CYAN|nr:TonB-dependent siderophore receptor [Pseudocalidococcus azoricus]MDS3862282.1 TonB-dependent siderophore receptor [Pseudocalidococcus azoricus BACA0444]
MKLMQNFPIFLLASLAIPLESALASETKPAQTVQEWLQAQEQWHINQALSPTPQLAQATVGQITGVEVQPTETGIQILFNLPGGADFQVTTEQQGTTLTATIQNAQLNLPNQTEFQQDNPTAAITSVLVKPGPDNTIEVVVVGKDGTPTVQFQQAEGQLIAVVGLTETPISTPQTEQVRPTPAPDIAQDGIEIVVTAEGASGFFVPNASTALGTDTPIINTPFSVQVVPQDVIRSQQAITIQEAVINVSSVIDAGTNAGRSATFSIRGFGNQFSAGAPVLRDGFRIYGGFEPIPELANLERVEVLKGPSSILFGQIEPGGVINLVSKRPTTEPFAELELQAGNFGLVRPRFDLSGPLTPNGSALYRVNGVYQNEWSFRSFDNAQERFSIAPVLVGKIDDRTDVEFSIEYINSNGPADFGITQFGSGVAPIPYTRVINDPNDTIATTFTNMGYSFEHRFNDNWKIRNGFRYLSYSYDYSVVALPFIVLGPEVIRFYADQDGDQNSYSLSTSAVGKFATGFVQHELLLGVDLNRAEDRIITVFGGPSILNIFNPDYDLANKPSRSQLPLFGNTLNSADRLGIYLQDQVSFLKNLILVAGLRYDTVTQKTTNVQTAFIQGGASEQTDDAVTPRFGLLYRPMPELSLFANYSQSFSPNIGAVSASGQPLPPTRGQGFEFGIKTELFQENLLATLTYYDITKQNVVTADPTNLLFSAAVGEQQSQGFEFDVTGQILPGLKIIGSYAYINARVTADTDPSLVGNQFFGVPYNSASLWMTYELQSGPLQGLGFGAGFNYVGNRYGNLQNNFTVGDYFIGNAAIFYQRDRYRIALNFKNLGNAQYIQALTGNEGGLEPGQPFAMIGSFSYRF